MSTPHGLILASSSSLGLSLAAVVVFGVGAQLLASRIKIPSVLLLLLGGVLAGPVLHIVDPDELLGDLLFPAVSLAVGILLFEGGLSLRFAELDKHGRGPIFRLVTIGVLVTWVIGGIAAYFLLGVDRDSSILLASILVVSGPTVVLPLVQFARVREPVNGILRWEGIFIDPVGATLAIVVLDAVLGADASGGLQRILGTAAAGSLAGILGAVVVVVMFKQHWVPDQLHNPFTLAIVVASFAGADYIRPEAGLFATTVLGVALANQHWAPIAHIREFEENLGSLILAGLFIILGARIDLDQLVEYLPQAAALSAVLILVARPVAVYLSTVGSGLSFVERAYLICLSPRGIVAASVSALFAIELEEAGRPVEALVPVTFLVIVITVLFSAVASRVGATRFRVARPEPTGVAFVGGPTWAIDVAAALADHEIPSLVITTDPVQAVAAGRRGVLTYTGKVDSEEMVVAMDGVGIKVAVAVSRFRELNSLAITRAAESIGRKNVFYLPRTNDEDSHESAHSAVMARQPFARACCQIEIEELVAAGGSVAVVTADNHDTFDLTSAVALLDISDRVPSVLTTLPDRAPTDGTIRIYVVGPQPATTPSTEPSADSAAATQGSGGNATP